MDINCLKEKLILYIKIKDIEKSSKKRYCTFSPDNHKNKKVVKSTCIEKRGIEYFYSLHSV